MDDTQVYISLLNPTEQTSFVSHLKKRNKRNDTKNIQLFQSIIKGKTEELKAQMGSNAYHVSKKRLTDRLIDFVAGSIIESEQSA